MTPRLDDAIDQVASRMTHVGEDSMLAARIVSALPERSAWSWRWLMPRLAITAALVMATTAVVLRMFGDPGVGPAKAGHHSSNSVAPAQSGHPALGTPAETNVTATPVDVPPVTVASAFRRTRPGQPDVVSDQPDHDFSLSAIEAVAALDVDALAPSRLPEDALLTIELLVIADLPLTAEFPMKEE